MKWELLSLIKQINRKIVPIITCKPWNPVATKKVEPYTESAIQKGASIYSKAWRSVKINPNSTVTESPLTASILFPCTILWCAHVTVAPELRSIAVFNKGTEKGFKAFIPIGGHITPISIEGDKLLWKKAQKKLKKNNTSETINNKKPSFKPATAVLVWWPWYVPSRITSFNQAAIQDAITIKPEINRKSWL